jgi:hypothetical protein
LCFGIICHRSKRRLWARGPEARGRGAVVGPEHGVAEAVRHVERHDLVQDVGRHLGVEREQYDAFLDVYTGDGHRDGGAPLGASVNDAGLGTSTGSSKAMRSR